MALDFPDGALAGDTFDAAGFTWAFDGAHWEPATALLADLAQGEVLGNPDATPAPAAPYDLALMLRASLGDGVAGQAVLSGGPAVDPAWGTIASSGGDVVGPASSVVGRIATFANTTGKLIADSGVAIGATVPAGTTIYDQLSWSGSAWVVQRAKYIFSFDIPGVLALNTVFSHVFTKAVTIPANFGSYLGHASQARGSVNAAGTPVITAAKATAASPLSFSNVGTVTIASGGVVPAFSTSGVALNFAQGDTIRFLVTTGDSAFADLLMTIVGWET